MNHFLLPEATARDPDAQRYGVHLMELLVNGMLGPRRRRATGWRPSCSAAPNVIGALSDMGSRNAEFAQAVLRDEGIAIVGGDSAATAPAASSTGR